VTDGESNASLRAGDSIESITTERAAELIQARRERGPAKPAKKRATPAKKRATRKKT
jgi:DNA topoisomerase-1